MRTGAFKGTKTIAGRVGAKRMFFIEQAALTHGHSLWRHLNTIRQGVIHALFKFALRDFRNLIRIYTAAFNGRLSRQAIFPAELNMNVGF